MFELILTLATAAVIAFAIALAGSVAAKRIAWRWRMVALPGPDSRHVEPTAMLGGVAIAIAFLASLALCGKLTMWVAAITCALTAVGLVDDLLVLRPGQKLAAQVAAALGFIIAGPPLALVHLRWLNSVLVFLWLIGTTNAFNLIDGLDGLAGGVGALAGLAVAVTAMLHHNPALALCAVALSGALCGFLVFNFHPASIFMGDAGALPVGFLLGIFALEAGRLSTNSGLAAFVFPVLVMIVPILDTAIVSTTRLATGRPISKRGLDHTHHRLLSLGVADRNVTYVCWGVGLLGALCAVGSSIVPHAYLVVALPFVLMPPALVALFMMDLTFD